RPSRAIWLYAILIVLAGVVSYSNSLSGPFIFDDQNSILGQPSLETVRRIFRAAPDSPISGRPVVALTFALNHRLGGLDVLSYHLGNIAIHVCVALLLMGVVRRTLLTPGLSDRYAARAKDLAFAVALVWLVHPL